jgi:hypothetical protein
MFIIKIKSLIFIYCIFKKIKKKKIDLRLMLINIIYKIINNYYLNEKKTKNFFIIY